PLLETGLQQAPNDPGLHYLMGMYLCKASPKDAVVFFQQALALSSKPTAAMRMKLLAAALASNQPLVFKETLTAVPKGEIGTWGKQGVTLAQEFTNWADKSRDRSQPQAVLAEARPLLELALQQFPEDSRLNYWMGTYHLNQWTKGME